MFQPPNPIAPITMRGQNQHQLPNRHLARAARPAFGLAGSDAGPTVSSVVRDTVNGKIVMTFALPTGATSLVQTGNYSTRIQAYQVGTTTAAFAVSGLVVSSNTITFNSIRPLSASLKYTQSPNRSLAA